MTIADRPLRLGFLGAGFIADFHLQALQSVRDVVVSAVYGKDPAQCEDFACRANAAGLGPCRALGSVEAVVRADDVDAIWVLGPNATRLEHLRVIHDEVVAGRSHVRAVACEKPLARTVREAREMLRLAEDAGLLHGYLENQVFAPAVERGREIVWRRAAATTGRPYLARASEEHSGPHRPWFWRASEQGGGALLDMMCHSVEVARYLLTPPGQARSALTPVSATGTAMSLKWTRPEYVERLRRETGGAVDYATAPAEDVAHGTITFRDQQGLPVAVEAATSWAYVGPGLRIQIEVLGPEYALGINTLNTSLQLFLSRHVTGAAGEDLVEKQNSEQGLMPVLEDEAATYGYCAEDRHMVAAFRSGRAPRETFADGVAVIEMLMALYRSAEEGRTVSIADEDLEDYVPLVARTPVAAGRA